MLLRSSSTPIPGSIPSCLSDSPNHHSNYHETTNVLKHHPAAPFPCNKLSVHMSPGSPHRSNASHNTSPLSRFLQHNCFRRVQSEGNLKGHDNGSYTGECSSSPEQPRKVSGRHTRCQSSLSFVFTDGDDKSLSDIESNEHFSINDRGNVEGTTPKNNSFEFSYVGTSGEARGDLHFDLAAHHQDPFLAIGLGLEGGYGGGSGGGYFNLARGGGDDGENQGVEEHYRKMVENDPSNGLFMRNYAQFLYGSKGDLHRAEEYYARAILADPLDGELLSQYGKLLWELHKDKDRASSYFERAVQASPQDSHVHAAYASFLWETEEEEDEWNVSMNPNKLVERWQLASA